MPIQSISAGRPQRPASEGPIVVVGYDRSQEACEAVSLAAERAGPAGTVVVLHVAPSPSESLDTAPYHGAVAAHQRREEQILADVETLPLGDASVDVEIVDGKPAEALIREAKALGAREIVIGSRGLGHFRGTLGSVSQDLLREADRPVVVVPRRAVEPFRGAPD
jgi:nucleotide-binding universal stress UspA family protein